MLGIAWPALSDIYPSMPRHIVLGRHLRALLKKAVFMSTTCGCLEIRFLYCQCLQQARLAALAVSTIARALAATLRALKNPP